MSTSLSFRLAWRSFLRHRRRSLITGSAISLSLALVLFFVGMSTDSHQRLIDSGIRLGSGHVLVHGKGFFEEQTLDHLVSDPQRLAADLRANAAVRYVVPRLSAEALISAGEHSAAVALVGVDPQLELEVSDFPSKKVAGHYLRALAKMPQEGLLADVYIGVKLAKKLEVGLGDRVVLTVAPRGGSKTAAAAFRVRGLFRTGGSEFDSFFAQIPLTAAQKLLAVGKGVTQLALHLRNAQLSRAVAAELARSFAAAGRTDLEVLPWQVVLRELYDGLVLDKGSMYVLLGIIFIIVTIGIFNTMLMSVVERTREFGVMMAIGTSRGRLFSIVLAEAVVLAAVASAVGVAIGYGLHSWLAASGIDMTKLTGGAEIGGVAMTGMIYSRLSGQAIATWTLVVFMEVFLAALYPAYRATRLKPVEAMRHV